MMTQEMNRPDMDFESQNTEISDEQIMCVAEEILRKHIKEFRTLAGFDSSG